ncbi:cell wall hydrolase [Priestia koreensis]|uniref:Spore cortex-lytic protein n=1 Tax=Priestia koreensis TaxID=284581 RepID=A0A0M0LHS4_9BACI|nr:cell wall hydrolase [Priestia koreensis]KOO50521.1 spore cortex-lytic protein [Priestia koreensis]
MKKNSMKKWVIASTATFSFLTIQGVAQADTQHNVHEGDTLWSLGQKYGVSVDNIKNVNHRQNDTIYIGETLSIPNGQPVQSGSYTVAAGDTLWSISSKHGVSVDAVKQANNLSSDIISIGQALTIPTGGQAPAPQPAPAQAQPAPAPQPAQANANNEEKELLARLVEAEAKGEPHAGKVAVATVVLNRVDSSDFPNSISEVINQPGAFSPVSNGAINQPASDDSKRAVDEAFANRGATQNGALFFYNPQTAQDEWIKSRQVTAVIGNHVFAK